MGFFGAPPPVAPPPPTFIYSWYIYAVALAGASAPLGVLFIALYTYWRRNWRTWTESWIKAAFIKTDLDKSGKISADELYVGVCETYLMMHAYGLNIKAPSRESVVKLLKDMDDDDSGEIDYEEFKELLQELMLAQSSRICTQLGLTVLSPVSAGYVVDGIKYAWIALALPSLPFLPDSLTEGSMGETVVTGMLMCSVNPMLALVTSLNEKRTALARQQKALNKKMKAQ